MNITLVINLSVKYKTWWDIQFNIDTGCTFLSFAKNNCKNVGKNIIINLSGKYTPVMLAARQNVLIMLQKYATDALKLLQKD